jgi:hypothetical protein
MATNKRKDAAALFELIDKSTLKVPKNAGSLKIPRWWSSPSATPNAPAAPAKPARTKSAGAAEAGTAAVAESAAPAVESLSTTTPEAAQTATPVGERESGEQPVQHRLFDPPPAHVMPETPPSIRPPSAGVEALSGTPKAPPELPVVSPAEEPADAQPATARDSGPAAAPLAAAPAPDPPARTPAAEPVKVLIPSASPRTSMPPTFARNRPAWTPRPGAFARMSPWAMLAGLAVVAVVVAGIVLATRHPGKNGRPATTTGPEVSGATGPSMARGGGGGAVVPRGLIYGPGEYQHFPDRYYIVICQTPSQKAAQEYANLLADRGISLSIELTQKSETSPLMYTLVSAFDFPTNTAAARAVTEIKKAGDKMSPNPFKDAGAVNKLRSAEATPAAAATVPARRGTR